MKIAVCSQGDSLKSPVDGRFGRCSYLIVTDTETGESEAHPNPALSSSHGAAVATVQFLSSQGVEVVLAQNLGPNAVSALGTTGISVYSPEGKTVEEALAAYQEGRAKEHTGATVSSHSGLYRK